MPDGSLAEFETRVEQDRAELAASLDRLSKAADPSALQAQASELASHFGQRAMDIGRQNPAAVALIGLGATMLVAGLGSRPMRAERSVTNAGSKTAVDPDDAMEGFDARLAAADSAMNRASTGESGVSAAKMRAALENGLDRLPEPARRRIIDLRLKAIEAQHAVERRTRRAAGKATGLVLRNPVESAAIALGLGAVAAAVLPSTQIEDRHLGTYRDHAMAAARDALKRERDAVATRMQQARAKDHPGMASAGSQARS